MDQLNDDDLVDMNEIIQCNLENWNLCPNTEPEIVCSQEIKLESYNFLGTKINYDDDKYELDSFPVPDHYFNVDNANNYESEDEIDIERKNNGNVINLTNDGSDDDVAVVNILNSSNSNSGSPKSLNVPVNICPHLVSIRSDHNYSSQEVFVGSPAQPADTEPESEQKTENECENDISEPMNELQSLIQNFMNNATTSNKIDILNDLENEVKKLKSKMLVDSIPVLEAKMPLNIEPGVSLNHPAEVISHLECRQPPHHEAKIPANREVEVCANLEAEIPANLETATNPNLDTEIPNGYDPKRSSEVSDSSEENDSDYIMSEGHSEPLEYSKINNLLESASEDIVNEDEGCTDVNVKLSEPNVSGEVSAKEAENNSINDIPQQIGTKEKEVTSEETTEDTQIVNGQSLTIAPNVSVQNNDIKNEIDNVRSVIERLSLNFTSITKSFASDVLSNETLRVELANLTNTGQELVESIKYLSQILDDRTKIENKITEDKVKLNDKSKQRWLASSSSDDDCHSEESTSEIIAVKRRRKRRAPSTSEEEIMTKTTRKKNVLLDSSENETSEKSIKESMEWTLDPEEKAADENTSTELEKDEFMAKATTNDKISEESDDGSKDIDMSKYLLPSTDTTEFSENKICDGLESEKEQLELSRDAIVDSELEEFLGFDSSASGIENVLSPQTSEAVSEKHLDMDTTSNIVDTTDTETAKENESETNIETPFVPSQEWNVPEHSAVADDDDNNELLADELPSKQNLIESDKKSTENNFNVDKGEVELDGMEHEEKEQKKKDHEEKIQEEKEHEEKEQKEKIQEENEQEENTHEKKIHGEMEDKDEEKKDEGEEKEDNDEEKEDEDEEKEDEVEEKKDEGEVKEDEGEEKEEEDEDGDDEYDTDQEIDRLVDLSTIPVKIRPIVNYVPVYRKRSISKPKPKEDILDIIKDSANQDVDSDSSSEEEVVSEEQYVLQLAKHKWLKESSDDSDNVESDSVDNEGQSSNDELSDESNDSKINTFLKKRCVNAIENEFQSGEKTEDTVANLNTATNASPRENTVDDVNDIDYDQNMIEQELQSSGIFEPEIELHDGEKLSEIDHDSDDDDIFKEDDDNKSEVSRKTPEDKKKWKLDKIAFNKNLFNNLDDLDEKENDAHVINSDNSDCEMLDISMFKTKKTTGDLDKIIQNQKKRDVSKTSKVADECISLSSDSDLEIDKGIIDDDSEDEKPTKSRPMLRNDQLAGETKQAQKEETDRLKRLEKKTERLTQIVESQSEKLSQSHDDSDVILDFDTKRNLAISVHPEIVKNLKEHQIAGVKFMYDCCYGSVDSIDKHPGSGCILAHCMGLGKTLQLIALLHTLIRYPQLKTKKVLVICPKSTIMNWADEIQIWLRSVKVKLKVLHFPDPSDINKKLQILREWHAFKTDPEGRAGCMLIGYEAFRSLVFYTKKPKPEIPQVDLERIKKLVDEYLLKPGADLVVCDEGHVIKNRKSTTSMAVNKISSRRRIILTGTPIQNNLKEYYSMVNFIKPSFLGTEKEFANLYENPIKEGQHKDSDKQQIRIMKQRSYVLHKKLSKFVQRREAALLKTFLPEKYEYVLFIPMTELQNRLYQYFLDNNPLKEKYGGKSLIPDYTFLRKIWTHPKVLENAWKNAVALRDKRAAARRRNMDSDEEPDDVLDNQVGKMSVENDWWRQFIEPQDLTSLLPSNKLRILFEILKLCQQNGEKCLIFSAFVAVLDVVEYFMQQINDNVQFTSGTDLGLGNFHGPWMRNVDYYRLDGKTSKGTRHALIQNFNDPTNQRVKCFLISAKAGGQGINLVGANRVILLDTSWNPSNDQQNIFRVFRLGQQKKCYIYRLLAMGTMEEKVYSRSVTKQAMSFRVVDEQQIDRHYSLAELAELYTLTIPDPDTQPSPVRPADNILASLLRNFKHLVYKYHEHDSLLENNSAEDLNEQEKADAWAAYENDVSMKSQFGNINLTADGMYNSPYNTLNMGLNMMHPYSYIPQNLPPSMVQSYLQRISGTYPAGVEQELLLMSQMYSQFNQPTASTSSYGPLGSLFSSPGGSTNSLYNSTGGNSNYFKSSIPPITTTSPSSYTNNMTTPLSSNVFNGISPLSSTSSAQPQNLMYNLARYLPYSSGMTGSSNQASSSTSSRPSTSPIASAFPFNLYSSPATATNTVQPLSTTQPGPNAIKNPLLSNLLPPSNTKDSSFSIPTSVITKASKDVQRATNTPIATVNHTTPISLGSTSHTQVSRSVTSNVTNQPNQSRPSSTHSSHSGSPTMTKQMAASRGTPSTTTRASPLTAARASPLTTRTSPLASSRSSPSVGVNLSSSRSSPSDARSGTSVTKTSIAPTNSLSITRTSHSLQKNNSNQMLVKPSLPLSITLSGGSRTSPEPNIIVKDVTAINRTVDRKSVPSLSSKTTQAIKNFNMGIVYPKAPEKKSFDLSQNDQILKAAQTQFNQLRSNMVGQSITQNPSIKSGISLQQHPNRSTNRPAMTAINRTNHTKNETRTIDKNATSSPATTTKNHLSSNLPTNEVTITPTKRLVKVALPATSISSLKSNSSTTITPSSLIHKPSIEINKINSALSSVSRLPSSTSITRQTPIPSTSGNTNTAVVRMPNLSKPIPKLSRQGSIFQNNNKPARTSNPTTVTVGGNAVAISRSGTTNQIARVVATNGVNKSTIRQTGDVRTAGDVRTTGDIRPTGDIRKVYSSPVPRLTSFANSSSADRKRKLEEMIPKNTGVTLIKKPKIDMQKPDNKPLLKRNSSFVGLPVQPKKVVQQRPRAEPSTVEIVELD